MAVGLAVFLLSTKYFNILPICGGAYSTCDNLITMAGEHAVYEEQATLLTMVVGSHTFCTEWEGAEEGGHDHMMATIS